MKKAWKQIKEKKVASAARAIERAKGNANCLKCDKRFKSKGPQNRLCDSCAYHNEKSYDGLNW